MLKAVNILSVNLNRLTHTPRNWFSHSSPSSALTCRVTASMQKEPGFPAWVANGNIQHLMYSHICLLIVSIIQLFVFLLLPELPWPVTTCFQASVNNILSSY